MASFLVVGFVCNALVRPVATKWLMSDPVPQKGAARAATGQSFGIGLGGGFSVGATLAWLAVGAPILWGVYQTLQSAVKIFG